MERKKLIKEIDYLYDKIDKCITKLVNASLHKNDKEHMQSLSYMQSLMVGVQQELSVLHDYFKEEDELKDKVDIWLRCHLPRVMDKVYSGDEEYENVLNEDVRQMMWEDLGYENEKEL